MEVIGIEARAGKESLLIGNVYRPPNAPSAWMKSMSEMLEMVVQESKATILIGDFQICQG